MDRGYPHTIAPPFFAGQDDNPNDFFRSEIRSFLDETAMTKDNLLSIQCTESKLDVGITQQWNMESVANKNNLQAKFSSVYIHCRFILLTSYQAWSTELLALSSVFHPPHLFTFNKTQGSATS